MITCLIVDDEQGAIDLLKAYIDKTPFLSLVASTKNPLDALSIVQDQQIDLIFLDIHMPQLSGFEFMKLIKGKSKVVLTTAYGEYALEGFEREALDYLLKPIAFERFLKAAQKALDSSITVSASWSPAMNEEDFIFVKTEHKGKMIKVNINDIIYVEGLKNYISIYTEDDRTVTLLNMKDLESRLPKNQFMRVHKSYIVALNKIQALDGNQILLKGIKPYIPLGETYRTAFFDALQQKIMGGKK